MSWRKIVSRGDGYCRECNDHFDDGATVWWQRGSGCMCASCGERYASNANRLERQATQASKQANASTPTPSSPPPETREQAIERMHGENVAAVDRVVAKLQMIAEQLSLISDRQQKRNELLYEKGAK